MLLFETKETHNISYEFLDEDGLDYVAAADSTASNTFKFNHIGRHELLSALVTFAEAAEQLNAFKKAMFRQRSRLEAGLPVGNIHGDWLNLPPEVEDLFHGTLGVATEAGEVSEILIKYLTTGAVSNLDVFEETGDLLWYITRLVKFCKSSFLSIMRANINKLRERHGDSFSKERDGNRDILAEQRVLHKGAQS